MYYLYFRNKQNELIALNSLKEKLIESGKIIPILEPVSLKAAAKKYIKIFATANLPLVLIVNPSSGSQSPSSVDVEKELIKPIDSSYSNLAIGFIIETPQLTASHLKLLSKYSSRKIYLLHKTECDLVSLKSFLSTRLVGDVYHVFYDSKVSTTYRDQFKRYNRIVLRDHFNRRSKNADYPPKEFFTDLHRIYQPDGFQGFGDFSIVGDNFFESGGPAYAVAIHFVAPQKGNFSKDNIDIHHFLSISNNNTQVDPNGKFLEALKQLVSHVQANPHLRIGLGVAEFEDLHRRQHFPNLGPVKKISIMHHLELIMKMI
ncbi:sce7725 family protein [Leptospira interrogans serovar Canicola]|uniref:Sce7725 family protein n=1 Tax=Leptospira interrogans serovar Canicola TaxID=211880 RepID=A0AAQ0AY08_LEPIR|nr:sce7725 family protein [Leptospira interrogans]QOI43026.1 sce7725 family protein [Leptospira interrogans serovar Canicola]